MRSDVEGEAAKVWRSFKPDEASVLSKGLEVLLVPTERNGKPTFDVELLDTLPEVSSDNSPQGVSDILTPDQKRAIATYVEQLSDLYSYCHRTASNKLPEADSIALSEAASQLFQAARAKFSI